ncbi:MAG: hypothetical protein A2X86_17650 [Bdellovibrionales bacterium GWA2_49_15]|nr:MAG: hypothetical protein A2X86_17650 [Bdellovibrionales bacterium GWA2_49_15]
MSIKKFEITDEDRKAAMTTWMNAPVIKYDVALKEYKAKLDEYCVRFNIATHEELMARADELEFDSKICNEILDMYSFIHRA